MHAGLNEGEVEKFIKEQNISDAYFENLKVRMGIKEAKPERKKKAPANVQSN